MDAKLNLSATLEERISKSGKPYKVLVIKLTDTYEKIVFLESAELELINMIEQNNSSNYFG